jgi:hypothetical protein
MFLIYFYFGRVVCLVEAFVFVVCNNGTATATSLIEGQRNEGFENVHQGIVGQHHAVGGPSLGVVVVLLEVRRGVRFVGVVVFVVGAAVSGDKKLHHVLSVLVTELAGPFVGPDQPVAHLFGTARRVQFRLEEHRDILEASPQNALDALFVFDVR